MSEVPEHDRTAGESAPPLAPAAPPALTAPAPAPAAPALPGGGTGRIIVGSLLLVLLFASLAGRAADATSEGPSDLVETLGSDSFDLLLLVGGVLLIVFGARATGRRSRARELLLAPPAPVAADWSGDAPVQARPVGRPAPARAAFTTSIVSVAVFVLATAFATAGVALPPARVLLGVSTPVLLLAIVGGLVGAVIGIVALAQGGRRGLSAAAIVLGVAPVVLVVLLIVLRLVFLVALHRPA